MYCHNCGKEIANQAKFCMHCGAKQNVSQGQGGGKKKFPSVILWIAAVAVLIFAGMRLFGGKDERVKTEPVPTKDSQIASVPKTIPQPATESAVEPTEEVIRKPQNGWHAENGDTYYFEDGTVLTGMQEIDDELYYFHDDGTMAINEDVDMDGITLELGGDGQADGIVLEYITGEWSSDKYHFGNNGTSSVLELEIEVEDCDYMTLYVEAEGRYGAKVNGNWKFYIRSHGEWVFAKEFYYEEPSGYVTVRFDRPMDFDAITAYPTVQGNASYVAGYMLCDVHMEF